MEYITVKERDGVPTTKYVCAGCGYYRKETYRRGGPRLPHPWGYHNGVPYCGPCRAFKLGDV